MVATFKVWKFDPPLDDKAFAFEPPAGSQRVGSLEDLFNVDNGGGRQREIGLPPIGKLAREIGLVLLDKGSVPDWQGGFR